MDEDTSIFIKKYKQILKFKSQATKKNKKNQRYNISTSKTNANTNNNNNENQKSLIILPNITTNIRKSVSSQDNKTVPPLTQKSKEKNTINNSSVSNKKYNILKIIDKLKNNGKEYRKYISQQSDISPKVNIKEIDKELYKRLLKKTEKEDKIILNNSADDTKINFSNEGNNNKPSVQLPFLNNVKSRYINYNEDKNKKLVLNKSSFLYDNANNKLIKKAKSSYKFKYLDRLFNKKEQKYYYLILPGNNSPLVEKCLLTRPNWEKISDSNNLSSCNLIWTALSQEINFSTHSENSLSQVINHFECHNEVSNKKNLFVNLLRYCEYNRINLFSFYPLTIILNFKQEFFNEQIEGFKQLYYDLPSLVEEDKENEKDKDKDKDKEDEGNNKYYTNYFRVNLVKRVGRTQKMVIPKSNYVGKNLWLLKRINLNRGREIKVLSDIGTILNEIKASKNEKKYNYLIIQKYIEAPFLYDRRKFDIRIWVLFSFLSNNYKFEVYVFKEGHLKACSETFDLHSDDLYVHLTNYSVQKYNKNFSKIEIGNEISFETFQNKLDQRGDGKNFKKDVFPKIVKIIAYSANASKNKINILSRKNCFEIFGYDFILDKNFEPFLLEINTNPGLEESSPLIKMLVPRMIDDAFRLTIDQVFERSDENRKKSQFKVDGYTDEENMWQYVNLSI